MKPFIPTFDDPPLQVILLDQDPSGWRMLCATIMLCASNRRSVDRVWPEFFGRWPFAHAVTHDGDVDAMADVLRSTGAQNQKARRLFDLSLVWANDAAEIDQLQNVELLPGCGGYAQESWSVFKLGRRPIQVHDHVIRAWVDLCDEQGTDFHASGCWRLPARLSFVTGASPGK